MSQNESSQWVEGLFDRKAAELLLYGRALGLGRAEAEDVLHDTFVALLVLPQVPHRPEHYVLRAFRNRALNHRRGWWRGRGREFESHRWFETAPDEDPREWAVMRALAELPPDQREVIVLKIWHRLTFAVVGEVLDVSPNTAAARYRYGLSALRRNLEDIPDEPEAVPGGTPAWLEARRPVPEA